jgi:hypothetical protein
MRIKSVTLYSLPYVVGVASFLVAAHQVAPFAHNVGPPVRYKHKKRDNF